MVGEYWKDWKTSWLALYLHSFHSQTSFQNHNLEATPQNVEPTIEVNSEIPASFLTTAPNSALIDKALRCLKWILKFLTPASPPLTSLLQEHSFQPSSV